MNAMTKRAWSLIALAGPANRQGRIAADVIAGRDEHERTAVKYSITLLRWRAQQD